MIRCGRTADTSTPTTTHTYKVTASDGTNTSSTPWRAVTVAITGSAYADRVSKPAGDGRPSARDRAVSQTRVLI